MSALGSLGLSAQIKGYNIVVSVTPDHQDWNYKVGEKANFTVNVRKSGTLLNNVKVDYEAGPAMFPDVKKSTTLKDGVMKWSGSLNKPGFYRFKVIAHVDGKDYEGLCTAGFSPEKIQPYAQEPKDFDAFWKKALYEARQTDLNITKVLLPERCTQDKNVYEMGTMVYKGRYRITGLNPYTNLAFLCCHFYREATDTIWTEGKRDVTLYKIVDMMNFIRFYREQINYDIMIEVLKKLNIEKKAYFTFKIMTEFYEYEFLSEMLSRLDEYKSGDDEMKAIHDTKNKTTIYRDETFFEKTFARG